MLTINIDPTLVQAGPLIVTWHGFFTAVGVLAGITLAVKYGALIGYSEDDIMSVALWGVIGGILGARLMHVIDQWGYYSQDPLSIVKINEGGLAIFGSPKMKRSHEPLLNPPPVALGLSATLACSSDSCMVVSMPLMTTS